LRIQQSGGGLDDILSSSQFGQGKYSSTLPPHRDTWASNIMQQLNWWMPLEEIDEGRTMCFFPKLFERKVPKTSKSWDFNELRQSRKSGAPYPQLPELDYSALALTENKEIRSMLKSKGEEEGHSKSKSNSNAKPVVVDPGDVVIFSGAHLHASVVNTSGKTRYSCEIRSVNALDYKHGKGAPNVDGRAPRVPLHWFHCVDDAGRTLEDMTCT
jgi:ectoine hydroxylase-related dioxygenase (phytanoyl-CoA dioxygenase family)